MRCGRNLGGHSLQYEWLQCLLCLGSYTRVSKFQVTFGQRAQRLNIPSPPRLRPTTIMSLKVPKSNNVQLFKEGYKVRMCDDIDTHMPIIDADKYP